MDLQLSGKVVLITGASKGIGLAAARMFAAEGAHVAIVARGREELEAAGRSITEAGSRARTPGRVAALTGDMSDPDVPARVASEVEDSLGPIDVLVNNVGLAYQATFAEVTDEQWDELWQLNVMSYVRMSRAVAPSMQARGTGVMVHVSSTAGKRPSTGMANYSVTKAAVQSVARLIADTYAGDGIRSLSICPGPTTSEAWTAEGGLADQVSVAKGISHADALAATGKGRPLGRMASPEEIASTIVFAASPRASYVTGSAWSVDGGSVPVII
ncbi:MAG: short-chain dehydrogenase/reductase [Thermoleophilia bacterium]|nr:short-chain dehydrogenase/reductase [Thermoleophilia bacterium]